MPHVVQDLAFVGCNPGGGEETSILGLCYKGADDRYARRMSGDWMIDRGVIVEVAQKIMTTSHAASTRS